MISRIFLVSLVVVACGLTASLATAGPETGKRGGREWGGMEGHKCGADLYVIDTAGNEKVFYPPFKYFSTFDSHEVDQGEMPRKAVSVKNLLASAGADAVSFTDCRNQTQEVTAGDAAEYLVVLTGKGVLKLARRLEDGRFDTEQKMVREIRFATVTE